jgi:diguanylate cyclase (GGDEF)-like protein
MREDERLQLGETIILDDESPIKNRERHPYLVIFDGNDSGRRHRLKTGLMTIGRSSRADITIDDRRISRIHCLIEWQDDAICIRDQGSTNGTFVDSRRISQAQLLPGLPIQLGDTVMKIEYKDAAEVKYEDTLLRRASIDELTGIFNRQHFLKLASMEMSYICRHQLPAGIIIIDIDNFKTVNDSHGHQFGDYVLAKFAEVITENKRREDLFGRFGGEEFIIMPRGKINKENLRLQCERIRRIVEAHEFGVDGTRLHITISVGFHLEKVTGDDKDQILYDLIGKADQALYLAKERGRNRAESFS